MLFLFSFWHPYDSDVGMFKDVLEVPKPLLSLLNSYFFILFLLNVSFFRRNIPRHIIITLPKIKQKERILKATREKETVTYKGVPIRLAADFSKETLQARKGWKEVFQVMKGKDLHPRLLYPAKPSFRMKGQIKCFPDKVTVKEFIITKPLLFEMLKGFI